MLWSTRENLDLLVYTYPAQSFANSAATIGHEAWSRRFHDRVAKRESIEPIFDPHNPDALLDTMQRARRKAGKFVGVLAVASDGEAQGAVGFAWGADDTSGSAPIRAAKRAVGAITGAKPWAWVAQINTLPQYQRNGIGTAMLDTLVHHFEPGQRTSTYVFDENPNALTWFRARGFAPDGNDPTTMQYFGAGSDPISQWRLQSTTDTVRHQIALTRPGAIAIVDGIRHA